jgi:hypothetical protein
VQGYFVGAVAKAFDKCHRASMQHAAPDRSEMDPEVCENNDETDPFGK